MLYRVLGSLKVTSTGVRVPAGAISNLKEYGIGTKTIQRLLAKNRIAEVHGPPLEIISGYEGREGSVTDAIEAGDTDLMPLIVPTEGDSEFEKMLGYPAGAIPQGAAVYDADAELAEDAEREAKHNESLE